MAGLSLVMAAPQAWPAWTWPPPNYGELPAVCAALGDARIWRRLDAPPADGAVFEYRLRRTAAYRAVMTGSLGQSNDTWVIRVKGEGYGICRQMSPSPRACGSLAVTFNKPPRRSGLPAWDVESARSAPCATGPI